MIKKRWLRIAVIVVLCAVILAGAAAGVYFIMRGRGKDKLESKASAEPSMEEASPEETPEDFSPNPEADFYHNGIGYRYKERLINVLILGVDKKSGETGKHQSDLVLLCVMDEERGEAFIISVPRDTMTDISVYDAYGQYTGEKKSQLALAYSYGSDGEMSAELTAEAVSKLFYGLPIHGWLATYKDTMPQVADSLGGVEVTLSADMEGFGKAGDRVVLSGDSVERYLQQRDVADTDSALERGRRQMRFLSALVQAAKSRIKQNPLYITQLLGAVSGKYSTDMDTDSIVYLASAGLGAKKLTYLTLEGENSTGASWVEYNLDEAALYDLILDVFYEKVED